VTAVVVDGIGELVTNDPELGDGSPVGLVRDAAMLVEGGQVRWAGERAFAPEADDRVDTAGAAIIPGFVDSHAHLMFAGDRAEEFSARMQGHAYSAGGISTTVRATRAATDEALMANATRLVREMSRQGTTTVEIKSGYGLTVQDETRALALARQLTSDTTFLGAHVTPAEYAEDVGAYVEMVTGPMLESCLPYARWIDVFCERGAFDADQARAVLKAGAAVGLGLRVHANQLGPGPGVQLACELGAAAADHCTYLSGADVDALVQSSTVATLLPGVEFSTRSPYPDARRLLDAGVTVGLATDCNPGSCFTSSMPLCIALGVREMHMSPAEALWSATAGGAAALRRPEIGRLSPGAAADFAVLDAPSYVHLAYRPGVPLVAQVWRAGQRLH
jgi:imidazolonepropionase